MPTLETSPGPSDSPQLLVRREEVLAVINRGRTRRRLGSALSAAVLALAVGAGVFYWQRARAEPPTTRFSIGPAKLGPLKETVTATGTLSPVDAVEVGAEVTGRLTRVLVDVNDRVEAGQILAEIDRAELGARVAEARAQLASAEANIASAKATLAEAELKSQRAKSLGQSQLASQQDVESAEAAFQRAKAGVESANAQRTVARAGLTSAANSLQKTSIIAPIAGIVLVRAVEPGQTVTAGFQTPVLFTLARDLTSLELNVEVDEADIGKVKPGQVATFVVDAYPEREFESKLVQLHNMPKAGATVVTYPAVLKVDNSDLFLKPGMTATATIVTRQLDQQLLVENRALRFEPPASDAGSPPGPGFFLMPGLGRPGGFAARPNSKRAEQGKGPKDRVFVEKAAGQLERVPVSVLASDGVMSAVKAPQLKAGSRVVVDIESKSAP